MHRGSNVKVERRNAKGGFSECFCLSVPLEDGDNLCRTVLSMSEHGQEIVLHACSHVERVSRSARGVRFSKAYTITASNTQGKLATCMALHERLGALSFMNMLSSHMLEHVWHYVHADLTLHDTHEETSGVSGEVLQLFRARGQGVDSIPSLLAGTLRSATVFWGDRDPGWSSHENCWEAGEDIELCGRGLLSGFVRFTHWSSRHFLLVLVSQLLDIRVLRVVPRDISSRRDADLSVHDEGSAANHARNGFEVLLAHQICPETGTLMLSPHPQTSFTIAEVTSVSISSDARTMCVCYLHNSHHIDFISLPEGALESGTEAEPPKIEANPYTQLAHDNSHMRLAAFSPSEPLLVSLWSDGTIRLISTDDWACTCAVTMQVPNRMPQPSAVAFSPDGLRIVAMTERLADAPMGCWFPTENKPLCLESYLLTFSVHTDSTEDSGIKRIRVGNVMRLPESDGVIKFDVACTPRGYIVAVSLATNPDFDIPNVAIFDVQ